MIYVAAFSRIRRFPQGELVLPILGVLLIFTAVPMFFTAVAKPLTPDP